MGYRYDGRSGWVDGRVPTYRDLAQALADIGVDPRRVRAWPNQLEISALFVGARPAPEELLAAAGPDYTAEDVRALLGERGARAQQPVARLGGGPTGAPRRGRGRDPSHPISQPVVTR